MKSTLALAAVALTLPLGGCLFTDHSRYQKAEARYRECLDEHPRDVDACEPLRATRDREFENYERTAKRAWGCDRTPEGCDDTPASR